MTKWILITQHDSIYKDKVLELKEGWTSEIYNGTIVWFIESVNGEIRTDPDFFEYNELDSIDHIEVSEKALNLLAFI